MAKNAAGDIYAALCPERQCEIAGDSPEHRTKHFDRGAARRASAFNAIPGDLGGAALWQDNAVEGREGLVKVLQPTPGKNAL